VGGVELYSIDFKKSLRMEIFDEIVAGFWSWVRLAIIWSVLITMLVYYAQDLREAIVDALTIPREPQGVIGSSLPVLGTMFGGPVGFAAGKATASFISVASKLAIITVLMFLASIMVATATTFSSDYGPTYLATQAAAAFEGPGDALANFLNLCPFPVVEFIVFGLNYTIAKFTLDNTTSIVLVWFKVRPI